MSHSFALETHLARLALAAAVLAVGPASAAEVRGVLALPADPPPQRLGYTQTKVAGPSAMVRAGRGDAAVFLRSVKSGVLPPPTAKWPVKVAGMRLEPSVLACAVDESLEITNTEKFAVNISVGDEKLAALAPGDTAKFSCQHAGPHALRVAELPHVRGMVFVGTVGISAQAAADGKFTLNAPDGEFKLALVGNDGVLQEVAVTIAGAPVELGKLEPRGATPDVPASPGAKAEPAPKPPAAPRPPAEAPKPKPSGEDEINLEP